jgi:hypothetical protein
MIRIPGKFPLFPCVVLLMLATSPVRGSGQQSCRVADQPVNVAVSEASGIAASQHTRGQLWLHNDSGEPTMFAVSADGSTRGQVYVSGASAGDWPPVRSGPACTSATSATTAAGAARSSSTAYRSRTPAQR